MFDEPRGLRRAAGGDRLNESIDPSRIPRDLEDVVMKAIAKDPERRYPTVDALAADLRRCRTGAIPDGGPLSIFTQLGCVFELTAGLFPPELLGELFVFSHP